MTFDGRPVRGYTALADVLREEIANGTLPPGGRFPSERELMQRFELGRDAVRDAIAVLRQEGLVVVRHGQTTKVVNFGDKQEIEPEPGSTAEAKMPSPHERQLLADRGEPVPEGWPVWLVVYPDGTGDLYPAHLYRIRIPRASSDPE